MGVKVYATKMLQESLPEDQFTTLMQQFKEYKEKGVLPGTFGRDVAYHDPSGAEAAELKHIHLKEEGDWSVNLVQFHRTSDIALVYCKGWHSANNYLLICILQDAHRRARKVTFMMDLIDIAEKFRERF